ncbi:MAG TPA: SDR family NAD(P)-dependent oxidoreductase [Trueperaceae bacterium]|nr:SDR family NAD(P)-dependent oxidoreductase [Trueperaceae bacterium]
MPGAENRTTTGDGAVFVTGAGGSVAPFVGADFLELGRRVVLFDRPGKEARVVARQPRFAAASENGDLLIRGVDLASEGDVARTFAAAEERAGYCRALINMAGGFGMAPADKASIDDLDAMLDVNLRSAVNATRAVLPGMLKRGAGFVLAIGAGAALTPSAGKTAYAAAKAAVSAYFGSLAAEVGKRGVSVAVLHPMGTIDTQANRDAMPDADTATWISLDAMVGAIRYLATRPARGIVHELKLSAH